MHDHAPAPDDHSAPRSTSRPRLRPWARWLAVALAASGAARAASTYENQKAFVDMRFGMFIHFNLGTFVQQEWALPNQDPQLFAPPKVDCEQWAAAAKSAGMKFAVLTTKHHDGFALWPTKYQKKNKFGTYQNVMSSKYQHDVVKQYVDAFRAAGVTPCLYFSIWDRTEGIDSNTFNDKSTAAGRAAAMATITGQLTELLTNYGDIPLIFFDGYTWMTGRNKVAYQTIRDTVRALQPNILIADHNGLTQPFEEDILNFEHFNVASTNTFAATQGNKITDGWFWMNNGKGNGTVRSASAIGGTLKNTTEPVWCNYLLNCPPSPDGVLIDEIVTQLKNVPTYWKPNTARKPLPDPGVQLDFPVTPVAIAASSTATGFKPDWAIDGVSDWVSGAAVQRLWQSAAAPSASAPQWLTLDLGKVYPNISLVEYMPSQARTTGNNLATITGQAGMVTGYNIHLSVDNAVFTKVAGGTFPVDGLIKKVPFAAAPARYVKFEITGTQGGGVAVVHELDVGRSCAGASCTSTGVASKPASRAALRREAGTDGFRLTVDGAFRYRVVDPAGRVHQDASGSDAAELGQGLAPGLYLVDIVSAHGRDVLRFVHD